MGQEVLCSRLLCRVAHKKQYEKQKHLHMCTIYEFEHSKPCVLSPTITKLLCKCTWTYLVLCWWPAVAWALGQYGWLTDWRYGRPENTPSPWSEKSRKKEFYFRFCTHLHTDIVTQSNNTETIQIIMLILAATHIITVHLAFNYTVKSVFPLYSLTSQHLNIRNVTGIIGREPVMVLIVCVSCALPCGCCVRSVWVWLCVVRLGPRSVGVFKGMSAADWVLPSSVWECRMYINNNNSFIYFI